MKSALIICLLFVVSGSVTAQEQKNGGSEWNLVYENDENGKKLGETWQI